MDIYEVGLNYKHNDHRLTANVKKPVWPRLLWTALLRYDLLPVVMPYSVIYF